MDDSKDKTALFESMYAGDDPGVMLTESNDHETLLAFMYDSDSDDEPDADKPKADRPYGIMNMPKMSSEIRKMQEIIDSQERMIKRINQRLRKLERSAGDIAREVNQMGTDMESKVDRSFR